MDKQTLRNILKEFADGKLSIEETIGIISSKGILHLGHSNLDVERKFRTGFPEVIFCENKSNHELLDIVNALIQHKHNVIMTRLKEDQVKILKNSFPDVIYYKKAKMAFIGSYPGEKIGLVSVLTGGTSDIPVAEEAAVTAELFSCNVKRFYDVGVAGIHRILEFKSEIEGSNVIVAVAGMEGALPSVVGGIFGGPIIAVPTSIGYGANFGGIAPLLSMLNSCSPGVAVVNIDNGFGAGYMASIINKRIEDARKSG